MNAKKTAIALTALLLSTTASAGQQWVVGQVSKIQEYGGFENSQYQTLITLTRQNWAGQGDGPAACTDRFRIKENAHGVTIDIKNRMFDMLMQAHFTNRSVSLYVDTSSAPNCNIIVTGIGDHLP